MSAAPGATGDLAHRLLARGFGVARPWMTFHRPAGEIAGPETGLRVIEADARSALAFGGIVAAAFALPPDFAGWLARVVGVPGWTCLLALDDDVPVGAAGVVVAGGAAWFGLGATLAEHRGKGAQGALFAARVARRARRRGPPLRDRDGRGDGRRGPRALLPQHAQVRLPRGGAAAEPTPRPRA